MSDIAGSGVSMILKNYIVETENGERTWQAEDADHAREQHEDAFDGDPGEEIISIREEQ